MSQPAAPGSGSRERDRAPAPDRSRLLERYAAVRSFTLALCETLDPEDALLQAMPDVSPTKWHLAHTTWFFERFLLEEHAAGYRAHDPQYYFLFNSYYNSIGPMQPRPERGLLSRPTLAEVIGYRSEIDGRVREFVADCDEPTLARIAPLLELGCHHEQQHQELILTDIKYNLSRSPLLPAFRAAAAPASTGKPAKAEWHARPGGVREIGAAGSDFCFDNETPRHAEVIEPHALASRLVTNGEFLAFVADDGYRRPELWLDAGTATRAEQGWEHPLYWLPQAGGAWLEYTLAGPRPLDESEPVTHVSFFEADAFARWSGCRLPTEAEWELSAAEQPVTGNFADDRHFHPRAARGGGELEQLYGDVWEWTGSPYVGYPGYRPPAGAVGEYNGKFMCNQFVLRGGSCATPCGHVRPTYRNFFPPDARWQFSGVRLATDA
jgi:ergothioneine biosynthesis protein EgtB